MGFLFNYLTGTRVQAEIPRFLTVPVETFTIVMKFLWKAGTNFMGPLYGFGYQNITDELVLTERFYSLSVMVNEYIETVTLDASDANTGSMMVEVSRNFQLMINGHYHDSDMIELQPDTWYTASLTYADSTLTLYLNGRQVMEVGDVANDFLSSHHTAASRLLVGNGLEVNTACLQVYTDFLSTDQMLLAAHRCDSNGKLDIKLYRHLA